MQNTAKSDTPVDSQTALRFDADGTAKWDLLAPVVSYPLDVDGKSGKKFRIGVTLRKYTARALKEALSQEKIGYVGDGSGDQVQINRTYKEFMPMIEKAFVGLDQVTVKDPTAQWNYLQENPNLRVLIAKNTFGGIRLWMEVEDPEPVGDLLEIDTVADAPVAVDTCQLLWSLEKKQQVLVRMSHLFKRPTQMQYHRAQSAMRQKIGKRGASVVDVNHDVLEVLYNESICGLSGMFLGTTPCTEGNKEQWVGEVPLFHKLLTVMELYRETRIKN